MPLQGSGSHIIANKQKPPTPPERKKSAPNIFCTDEVTQPISTPSPVEQEKQEEQITPTLNHCQKQHKKLQSIITKFGIFSEKDKEKDRESKLKVN